MSIIKEKILAALQANSGLTDREITDLLLGGAIGPQKVNQAARSLEEKCLIERRKRADGKIGNFIAVGKENNCAGKEVVKITTSKKRNQGGEAISYDREIDLRQKFNKGLAKLLDIEEKDYYSRLATGQMDQLKTIISNVNNIITLRLAVSLTEFICNKFDIAGDKKNLICEKIKTTKPNANGFDLQLSDPDIVAEIKCNIPINGGQKFGSAQKKGLMKDINSLLYGKRKPSKSVRSSIKIMGLYDTEDVRAAIGHFIEKLDNNIKSKIKSDFDPSEDMDREHIYIVFVK